MMTHMLLTFDLQKVSDTSNHDIFLQKLYSLTNKYFLLNIRKNFFQPSYISSDVCVCLFERGCVWGCVFGLTFVDFKS